MINRQVVRCAVCEATTLVRIQVGWQEQFPVRFACGGCQILVTGDVVLDFERLAGPTVRYENAALTNEEHGRFHVEVSSEYLMAKVGTANGQPMEGVFSPFMRAVQLMGDDRWRDFGKRTQQFLAVSKSDWPRVRRANELWLRRQLGLLAKDVADVLPPDKFPTRTEAECSRAIRVLNAVFLDPVRRTEHVARANRFLDDTIRAAPKALRLTLANMAAALDQSGLLADLETRILQLTGAFVERFRYLVPAFGLRFVPPPADRIDLDHWGMTTASFEDLKQLYVDSFELATDVQILLVAWNNALVRTDWQRMARKRRDVRTLDDFAKKKKGERTSFLELNEPMDWMLGTVDNQLRNGIAHNSYQYDNVHQRLTYFPSGDKTSPKELFLVEVAQRCVDLFDGIQLGADAIFATRKIRYWTLNPSDSKGPGGS